VGPASSEPRKSWHRKDGDRKGDRDEEKGGGGGEGGRHKLRNYYLRKAPAVPPAKRRKAGRVVTDSKYGRQPRASPRASLITSLLPEQRSTFLRFAGALLIA